MGPAPQPPAGSLGGAPFLAGWVHTPKNQTAALGAHFQGGNPSTLPTRWGARLALPGRALALSHASWGALLETVGTLALTIESAVYLRAQSCKGRHKRKRT